MAANQANVPSEPQLPAWMGAHIPIPRQQPIATSLVHHLEELDLISWSDARLWYIGLYCLQQKACARHLPCQSAPASWNQWWSYHRLLSPAAFNALPKLDGWLYDQGVANVICQANIEDHPEYDLDYDKVNLTYTMTHLPTG